MVWSARFLYIILKVLKQNLNFITMPVTIPYHPSLVLGNIVPKKILEILKEISDLQSPIEAAFEEMNSKFELKLSINSVIQELIGTGAEEKDIIELEKSKVELNKAIIEAAHRYVTTRIAKEKEISQVRAKLSGTIGESLESPIDYNRSMIKTNMPLSFDSLKLDSRYFSFDETGQGVDSSMRSLKSYVKASTSFLGSEYSAKLSNAAQAQVASQREHHDIQGTLVISVACTHKNALLFAPFILDVDKAIRVWNTYYKNKKIRIGELDNMLAIVKEEGTNEEEKMEIISGATCGSSFIGMVHILRTSSTESTQALMAAAASMQGQMKVGGWFAKASGGFGVDTSFANDVKKLLSQQEINSHVGLITMGVIPDIKSNDVAIGVKAFADYDPGKMMEKLAVLQNATASEKDTVASQAKASSDGETLNAMHATQIKSVISGLAEVDDGKNKMLDINSLMDAFSDYVEKIKSGSVGVPVNYYLKPITRSQLAQMWVAKYYPEKYLNISGDDSKASNKASQQDTQQDTQQDNN